MDVIQRLADRAASGFDRVDFIHSVTREGLLERLRPMVIDAGLVVDLGAATGSGCRLLAKRFRGARVLAVDVSSRMLERAKQKRGWFTRSAFIQADALALPLRDHSVDVVFANLLLPWIDEPAAMFAEAARVLRKDGIVAFSALGPDSLVELRQLWRECDVSITGSTFFDMHDIGDAAVRGGLRDPVLDVDRSDISYADCTALVRDLKLLHAPAALLKSIEERWTSWPMHFDLELVYGHCWGSGAPAVAGEHRIDAARIGHRQQ